MLTQFEGIAWNTVGTVLLSNEQSPLSPARLWTMTVEVVTGQPERPIGIPALQVIPGPASGILQVHGQEAGEASLFDMRGEFRQCFGLDKGINTVVVGDSAPGGHVLRSRSSAVRFVWLP